MNSIKSASDLNCFIPKISRISKSVLPAGCPIKVSCTRNLDMYIALNIFLEYI